MHYVGIAIDLILVGLFVWIIGAFAYYLATEQGSIWQRLLAAAKDSATMVWAKLCIAFGALVGGVVSLADVLGQPQIGEAVHKFLTPQVASGLFLAAMIITALARNRSLGK